MDAGGKIGDNDASLEGTIPIFSCSEPFVDTAAPVEMAKAAAY